MCHNLKSLSGVCRSGKTTVNRYGLTVVIENVHAICNVSFKFLSGHRREWRQQLQPRIISRLSVHRSSWKSPDWRHQRHLNPARRSPWQCLQYQSDRASRSTASPAGWRRHRAAGGDLSQGQFTGVHGTSQIQQLSAGAEVRNVPQDENFRRMSNS